MFELAHVNDLFFSVLEARTVHEEPEGWRERADAWYEAAYCVLLASTW